PVAPPKPGVVFDVPAAFDRAQQQAGSVVKQGLRNPGNPFGAVNFGLDAAKTMAPAFGFGGGPPQPQAGPTPVTQPTKLQWAKSYNDPVYDQAEMQAAKELGLGEDYLQAVRSIRTQGERSNNGQVSSAGAQTPYQFIPSTREGMIKNYGVDPWADPVS